MAMPRIGQTNVHNFTYHNDHGFTMVKCRCGGFSPWFADAERDELVSWCNDHSFPNQEIARGALHGRGVMIRKE